ncbi:LysR family transcriptional regulator [Cellvibrio polysaccharolyticus]|uniref:LysR family transcriptional regulator n=1 Tax=Cellvibrio polysaccharolyticus TaxID=2082724 RepID=A0A928YU36_9GAMM|nr:LysR family transcriptional regulator [Cellvibrio polysaccharolyticus]MBE8715723.1 LysR family transcriptional regulator [Cellvibrio polysaccharolyticus]
MDNLGALNVFLRAAEMRSFTLAGQKLGISASAVSKAIVRLETRLGVRLFHRSTRTINLTPEGVLFMERCRRIVCELESAEAELSQTQGVPKGKLRISLPSIGTFFMAKLTAFKRMYPDIQLDIDYSDRLVDVIEEGFDAVIRSGEPADSRLMARRIGSCRKVLVGSPLYFERKGTPRQPQDLNNHDCLLYRYPGTGKLAAWPVGGVEDGIILKAGMVTNTLDPQICFAESGLGIACVPELAVRRQLQQGSLVTILDDFNHDPMVFNILWPSGRHLSPRIRVFVDFIVENLFPL